MQHELTKLIAFIMVDGSTYANMGYDTPQWDTFHKEANCTDTEITIGNSSLLLCNSMRKNIFSYS